MEHGNPAVILSAMGCHFWAQIITTNLIKNRHIFMEFITLKKVWLSHHWEFGSWNTCQSFSFTCICLRLFWFRSMWCTFIVNCSISHFSIEI